MAETTPLKLYWWNREPNFGDAISQTVTAFAAGRPVEWGSAAECDLFAVGSILTVARRAHTTIRREVPPFIWGSGSIGPHRADFVKNVEFASVRGPLTASHLGIDCWSFGDPGLLIKKALGGDVEPTGKIGIVPHHGHADAKWLKQLVATDDRLMLIKPGQGDAHDVVRQIASCSFVFSSSLHGIIVADSYGVPNQWLTTKFNHQTPDFKFFDYALSIGRILGKPLEYREIAGFIDNGLKVDMRHLDKVEDVKEDILSAFPAALKAGAG